MAEQANMWVTLHEFAESVTGLTGLNILAATDVIEALAVPFADGETGTPYLEAADLRAYYQELQARDLVPADLRDIDAFGAEYNRLLDIIPQKVESRLEVARGEAVSLLLQMTARFFAREVYSGNLKMDLLAGVKVEESGEGLVAQTVSGLVARPMSPQTRTVVEYGPGLAGGARRVKECQANVWEKAHLLNTVIFPSRVAEYLGELLLVPPDKLECSSRGMADGAADLLADEVRCDMVIASKVGFVHETDLRPALAAAHQLLVPGGMLVMSDFTDYSNADSMIGWATEYFGHPPDQERQGNFGSSDRHHMRDAVFVRR